MSRSRSSKKRTQADAGDAIHGEPSASTTGEYAVSHIVDHFGNLSEPNLMQFKVLHINTVTNY